MEFIQIKESEFDFIFQQMELNFILEERRDFLPAKNLLKNKDYTLYHISEGSKNVGFIAIWDLVDAIFIEHFVVYEKFRNLGYGSTALTLAKEKWGNLVLECELPSTEIAKRRLGFYGRNGFVNNEKEYYQPSYRKGGDGVYLTLMSCPSKIDDFENTKEKIYKKVYNK